MTLSLLARPQTLRLHRRKSSGAGHTSGHTTHDKPAPGTAVQPVVRHGEGSLGTLGEFDQAMALVKSIQTVSWMCWGGEMGIV